MTNDRWDAPHHKEDKGLMNKQVTFKFSVGGIFKILFVLAILVGVFMLGRWSVSGTSSVAVDSEDSSHSGFFSRIFGGEEKQSVTSDLPVVMGDARNSSESSVSNVSIVSNASVANGSVVTNASSVSNTSAVSAPVAQNTTTVVAPVANITPAVPVKEEEIITEYSAGSLAFTINSVRKEWYDTWGKMVQFDVSFKNNEDGTINAKYITMTVEGYDYDKQIPLVEDGVVAIKAGQTKNMFVEIPGGFAYNKLTAGDLKNIRIMAVLSDAKSKPIATFNKEFNLDSTAK